MSGLAIASDLELPLDLVTEASAIVATRGAGKSSASAVMVEEAIAAGVQVIVFDRTGVYWGLRSSSRGAAAGLAMYVLGGPHADVPLEAAAGKMIADLVVDTGHSFVLDLSDFSKSASIRFAADFLERLYDRKARSRSTVLVVMDEAHFYAPQTPRGGFKGDSARLMGAMEDVVGLGRSRGLGVVLTTQRTQSLNKAVLDLIETLLVMRMLSPRARDAVKDWIQEKHEDDEKGVLKSLGSLPTGTAWVWSPLRGILQKVDVRRIRTFDSYATPKPGETRVEPKARKELDLAALGEQMAATVERAKADDPVELRKRIRELEQEAEKQRNIIPAEPPPPEVQLVHVPVVTAEVLSDFTATAGPLAELLTSIGAELTRLHADPKLPTEEQSGSDPAGRARPARFPATTPAPSVDRGGRERGRRDVAGSSTSEKRSPVGVDEAPAGDRPQLKAGARRIVETLGRHHPLRLTLAQLATLARFKRSGGTWRTYWSQIRQAGLVDELDGLVGLTDAGVEFAGVSDLQPLSPDQVLERWRGALKAGARRMLDEVVDVYPDTLSQDLLAERLEMALTGGTFRTYLSTLRSNGLVDTHDGDVRAADVLFLGAA